jgi:hypothetical protein
MKVRPSTLLLLVTVAVGYVCCVDGISFKKIYRKAKLKSVNRNNRKFEQSSAFFEKRSIYDDDDEDTYDSDEDEDEKEPRFFEAEGFEYSNKRIPPKHVDIIQTYTQSLPEKVLVSTSSALASVLISSFLSMMLFSSVWLGLVKVCAMLFFSSGFIKSEFGDLSRSLGVFLLLLLKQSGLTSFIRELVGLVSQIFLC